MFHVQEHQTDIPAIKSIVAANRLIFLGFGNRVHGRYAALYPDDKAMTNLDRWHAIETEHPTWHFCRHVPILVAEADFLSLQGLA